MTVDPSKLSGLSPAAGAGSRLGLGPKALLEIGGKSLLRGLVDKLLRVADEVIIAVPAGREGEFSAAYPDCRCIPGGASRQDSVRRLAEAAAHDWTILHDAARPFVSEALLRNVAEAARETGCAGAFLDPEVPVARLSHGRAVEAISFRPTGDGPFPGLLLIPGDLDDITLAGRLVHAGVPGPGPGIFQFRMQAHKTASRTDIFLQAALLFPAQPRPKVPQKNNRVILIEIIRKQAGLFRNLNDNMPGSGQLHDGC